jgi:sugar phosphate isomerase/epimerase
VRAIHECAGQIAHFHITDAELADLTNPRLDHKAIGRALRDTGYDGWHSIEMRRSTDPLTSIEESVLRVLEWYG